MGHNEKSKEYLKVALEERKIVQDIINNKEDIRMITNNWMITLIFGSSIVMKSHSVSSFLYILISIVVILCFAFIDLINRVAFYRMIRLSNKI
jgi:hypothetical protein